MIYISLLFHLSHPSCIFFFLLFSSKPPFFPPVCLLLSLSTLNLAVWLFISAHFSSCFSHWEGGGDPADQDWVMVYEHSLWAMRAPLGLIIYTGPAAEQTYVSQSHQRHSKAGLSTGTHIHPSKQQHFQTCYLDFDLLKDITHFCFASLLFTGNLWNLTWVKSHKL